MICSMGRLVKKPLNLGCAAEDGCQWEHLVDMRAALENFQVRFEVQSCQDTLQGAECSTLCSLHETTCQN